TGTPPPVAISTAGAGFTGDAVAGSAASENEKRSAVSIRILFMALACFPDCRSGDRARGGDVFPLPQLVAHHVNFEEQRRGIDAAPDVVEIRRADRRRTMDDVEQAALELVEDARDRPLAGVHGVLAIETARLQEVVRTFLFRRDVAQRGVDDIGAHAF